jgi:hypothetical protein
MIVKANTKTTTQKVKNSKALKEVGVGEKISRSEIFICVALFFKKWRSPIVDAENLTSGFVESPQDVY